MKTYTITTESGVFTYQAETQAGALRQHTQSRPETGVLGVTESVAYRAQSDVVDSLAD